MMAAGYLLDTNVISETRKTRADPAVTAFLDAADSAGLFLSVLTLESCAKVSQPGVGAIRSWLIGSAPG
jgi:predicted nucleic acid-binding protein